MSNYISTQNLFEQWINIVDGNIPHASIRIGDGEAVVLAHNEILTMNFINKFYTWVNYKNIKYCGVILPNQKVRRQLVLAYKQADFLGILSQTHNWMFKPIADMVVQYYDFSPECFFYAFDNYFISTKKEFYDFFKFKSVLLVGSKSSYFKQVLQRRYGWSEIAGCVDCKDWNCVEKAKQEMNKYKYRVALVSAGVPGKVLTAYAKTKGNVGIDFGSGVDTCIEADAQGLYAWEMKTVPTRNLKLSN